MPNIYYWVKYQEKRTGWILERGFDKGDYEYLKEMEKQGKIKILEVKETTLDEVLKLAQERDLKPFIKQNK